MIKFTQKKGEIYKGKMINSPEESIMPALMKFFKEKRWALVAISLGILAGFSSAIICVAYNLVIFGFNIMYIFSPLVAGFVENFIAIRRYGRSTGAISALMTFLLINGYGWFWSGWIYPKEPVTLSLITIIAVILTLQAAFPTLINYIFMVVLVGLFLRITRALVKPDSMLTPESDVTGKELNIRLDPKVLSAPYSNSRKRYLGIVTGECLVKEIKADGLLPRLLRIIEPGRVEELNLGVVRRMAISSMLENAEKLGADVVEEVLMDFIFVGGIKEGAILVTAIGTAIKLDEELTDGDSITTF